MAIYSISQRTTGTTSGDAAHDVRTTSTDRAAILEAGVFMAAATASTYGVGRAGSAGTASTSNTVQAEDPASPTGTVVCATAWSAQPGDPSLYFRRWAGPATIGTGVIWTFPRGLLVAVSAVMVLQNLASNGVVDSYWVVDE